MFMSREQKEHRKEIDAQIKQLEAQCSVIQQRYDANSKHIDAQINDYRASMATKWEYVRSENLNNNGLDLMGRMGWELVGLTSYDWINGDMREIRLLYVFKRPIPPLPDDLVKSFPDLSNDEQEIHNLNQQIAVLKQKR